MFRARQIFSVNSPDDLNKRFRILSLPIHPDKWTGHEKQADAQEVFKFISSLRTDLQNGRIGPNQAVSTIPVWLNTNIVGMVKRWPYLLEVADIANIHGVMATIMHVPERSFKLDLDNQIVPWTEIMATCGHQMKTPTRVLFLKWRPVFEGLDLADLRVHTSNFLENGGQYKTRLFGRSNMARIMVGEEALDLFRGTEVANNMMTFAKICCLIGEINRSNSQLIVPGLGRNLRPVQLPAEDFLLYIHHGVHFLWDDDLPRKNKMCILMAIYTLDYIFFNMNGLKRRSGVYRDALAFTDLASVDDRSFFQDLIKFAGAESVNTLIDEKKPFIQRDLEKLQFNVRNPNQNFLG